MDRYTDKDQKIRLKAGSEFEIALKANPSGGYSWKPLFDTSKLDLVVDVRTELAKADIGADTLEIFTFRTSGPGSTKIEFFLTREWTPEKSADKCLFDIDISPAP